MSLSTWKKEFYPVPAERATKSALSAAEHSLRKWRSALPSNLKKHGVTFFALSIESIKTREWFNFNAMSCALCQHSKRVTGSADCRVCVGMAANGKMCCDSGAAYEIADYTGNVKPMLAWLRKAVAYAKRLEAGK